MTSRVGGQAVPGGVALRRGDRMAVAVRTPSGEVAATSWQIRPQRGVAAAWGLRGVVALVAALAQGARAMRWARFHSRPEAGPSSLRRRALDGTPLVAVLVLLFGAPWIMARLLPAMSTTGTAFANSAVQLAVFVVSLVLLARMPPVRTLLGNHGAEHKVVAVHEAGQPLTVDSSRAASRFHPRCGTSFAALLVLGSSVVFPLADAASWNGFWRSLACTALLVGLTYEMQRAAARRLDTSRVARGLLAPGLWLQRLTTVDPSDDQVEVALEALTIALEPTPAPAITALVPA